MNQTKYKEALVYAFKLHEKQVRKGTSIPYFFHLASVSNLVIENGGTTNEAIAGLLHDAVEDQGGLKTLAVIKRRFGPQVAKIVDDCTDAIVIPKPPWFERKKLYLSKLKSKSQSSLFVSLCDKTHNAGCIIDDYDRVGKKIWKRFNAKPKDIYWYYHSLYLNYKKHLKGKQTLLRKYHNLIKELKRIT